MLSQRRLGRLNAGRKGSFSPRRKHTPTGGTLQEPPVKRETELVLSKRKGKTEMQVAKSAARSLPAHMQAIAFSKYRKQKPRLGKFGPASDVRHVKPEEVDVSQYLNPQKEGDV